MILITSPGPPTTRLMNVWLDSFGGGLVAGLRVPGALVRVAAVALSGSAPAGGWKTVMSPTLGWLIRRLARIRWPMFSVGSIEPLGIR